MRCKATATVENRPDASEPGTQVDGQGNPPVSEDTSAETGAKRGLATQDTTKNVDALEDYVNDPAGNGSPTGYPNIWVSITVPRGDDKLRTYSGTALLTSFRNTAPHDDVASWTMEGNSFAYTIATETAGT
ncbi:hypothetical protein [Salinicola halophyticus]|uniref:hypothetical protein n=1 Tax=Salinicola halophyticus TaxID=1808881 RepID=UPI003F6DF1B3